MDDVDYLGASGSVLSYNLYSYCENNPVNNVDYTGNLFIRLKTLGYVLMALALNPIAVVLISMGISKLKKVLIKLYVRFLAKIVMYIPTAIAKAIFGFIGAVVGVGFMKDFAVALFDCVVQGKEGIEIYIKKTRLGIPYGVGVGAK